MFFVDLIHWLFPFSFSLTGLFLAMIKYFVLFKMLLIWEKIFLSPLFFIGFVGTKFFCFRKFDITHSITMYIYIDYTVLIYPITGKAHLPSFIFFSFFSCSLSFSLLYVHIFQLMTFMLYETKERKWERGWVRERDGERQRWERERTNVLLTIDVDSALFDFLQTKYICLFI